MTRKTYEELTFTDDFMFCRVLENNADLCKQIIEAVLEKEVEIVGDPITQKDIHIRPDGRGIRLDIKIKGEEGTIYDLEMQNAHKEELLKRARYYQGVIDIDYLEKGANYKELPSTLIIFICTFDPFGLGRGRYTIRQTVVEEPDFEYNDGTMKIFLSSQKGRKGNLGESLTDLLDYVSGDAPEGCLSRDIDQAVTRIREGKDWRKEYMMIEDYLEDATEEGIKRGIEEGRGEAQREIAKRLKAAGTPTETIVECTGLSREKVESL